MQSIPGGNTIAFLRGGGEMGQRIREFDWATTSVGTPDTWPQPLCTTVNTILNSRFPMFLWWGDDLIQFYNDAYRPSLGNNGKHPSALGQRGEECWPEIWPVIYPQIQQVREEGISTWNEDQLIPIYRNGRLEDVYWTFSYSPIYDEYGGIGGVLVVCNENTEKMQTYLQLKESEDQLSFTIDAAELGTWDYNPKNGKFKANARLKSWFGLQADDEIDLLLAIAAIHEKDRARVPAAIQRAMQYESGGSYDVKYTVVNKVTGEERIVHAKGRAWFNDQKVAYRFNGTLQDITEQENARLQLVVAEEKARLAIESADLGTYEIDLASEVMTVSDRFKEIWGLPYPTSRQATIDRIHPDDRESRAKAFKAAMTTGNVFYEVRLTWPDGSIHWVRVKGLVSYDAGVPTTLTGVIQDISDQKEFEAELTRQVAERTAALEQSNEDLLQFAHVISHDLKEPVRKIKIFANRIDEEMAKQLPIQGHRYLGKIQNAADRMSSMIEGVLNYSSLTSTQAQEEEIDLNDVLRNIQTDLEIIIQQKSAHITYDRLPVVHGVGILIYQLFYNLINNSLKFSRTDINPIISVTSVMVSEHGGLTRISIADNGIGFEQAYAESIFETFTRLNSKDKFEGTGLGLSLSRKIVERHGGAIGATSRPGQGAIFHFTLPVAKTV